MNRSTFLKVNGMFMVTAGVIGIATIITSYHALAAGPRGGGRGSNNPMITQISGTVETSSGYIRPISTKWKTGSMKALGYAVLNEQAEYVEFSLDAQSTGKSGFLEYAFVPIISDQPNLTFSLKNKDLKQAAIDATDWSQDGAVSVPVTADMQGKWLTMYGFVRNGDGITGAAGLAQEIDDAAVLIFQVPKLTAVAPDAPATTSLLSVHIPAAWKGAENVKYVHKLNQVIGYLELVSLSDQPVEVKKIGMDFFTNGQYKNSIALVRTPQAQGVVAETSLFGVGDPSNENATSTIGLGFANTKNSGGGTTYSTHIDFPIAQKVVVAPKSTLIFALTADDLTEMSPAQFDAMATIGFKVTGIESQIVGSAAAAEIDESIAQKNYQISTFQRLKVNALLHSNSPSGAVTPGVDKEVMRFLINNGQIAANTSITVTGLRFKIAGENIPAGLDAMVRVYNKQASLTNLLGKTSVKYLLEEGYAVMYFAKPLVIENSSSAVLIVTQDVQGANAKTFLIPELLGAYLSDDTFGYSNYVLDADISVKGKMLVF